MNNTHLNMAETSPFIAPMQENSYNHVSELTDRKLSLYGKPRTKRARGIFCQNGQGPRISVKRSWSLHTLHIVTRNLDEEDNAVLYGRT